MPWNLQIKKCGEFWGFCRLKLARAEKEFIWLMQSHLLLAEAQFIMICGRSIIRICAVEGSCWRGIIWISGFAGSRIHWHAGLTGAWRLVSVFYTIICLSGQIPFSLSFYLKLFTELSRGRSSLWVRDLLFDKSTVSAWLMPEIRRQPGLRFASSLLTFAMAAADI